MSGENWKNVGILERVQERSVFSVCLKHLLKLRPGFILTSSEIFDSLLKKKNRAALPHKRREAAWGKLKQKAYPCVETPNAKNIR